MRPGKDYRRTKQYETISVTLPGGQREERLIKPMQEGQTEGPLHYVKNGSLYDRINEVHKRINHGGRNKMMPALKETSANITQKDMNTVCCYCRQEAVSLFLSLCAICQSKKIKKRGIVVKPLLFTKMNDRSQVDLIDFQSHPDEEFKHMTYQDYLTKFVALNAMRNKKWPIIS
ncbi:hypothetical protein FOCC_FOCC006202 [Frankliniella occidentalis]|nr:hypothetical protein FOCC_FOCC006202 [Frankliniella occidentalis]